MAAFIARLHRDGVLRERFAASPRSIWPWRAKPLASRRMRSAFGRNRSCPRRSAQT